MLKALFQFFTTPYFAPWVRKMGFLYEAIAMDGRYHRCKRQWQSHFEYCQQAILKAITQCEQKRSILILGAGSLKDIPLPTLSEQFEQVYLVDLVFLKSARKQAAAFGNVVLIEADVTGCLEHVFQGKMHCDSTLPWLEKIGDVDCVVSLNLTTQLPLIPISWLMKKYNLQTGAAGKFGTEMVEQHLALLNGFSGVKCLISDRWITEYDVLGNQIDGFDPAWDVPLPEAEMLWDWEVIPLAESTNRTSQINQVGVTIWC